MADDQFPPDIIYGILSRLPIKSLARFRCVCKSWFEYINNPYLQTIHVKEEPTPIIFQQPLSSSLYTNKLCKISFLRAIQGTTIVQKDPVLEFGYEGPSYRENMVLGSCNGLTLICCEKNPIRIAVIDPLRKECHDLPSIPISNWFYPHEASGIGFDDSTNTLKTVFVVLEKQIMSHDIDVVRKHLCTVVQNSGTSSWRKIPQIPAYPIRGEGVFAHGRLHWLVSRLDWQSINDGRKIVWFDVKMEEFGLTDPPKPERGDYGMRYDKYQLVNLNGEVGFAYIYIENHIELWILKVKEWVLHCSFGISRIVRLYGSEVSGCWNKDGDILLTYDGGERFFVYALKTGVLRQVDWRDRCKADIRMYQSSLFSVINRLKAVIE